MYNNDQPQFYSDLWILVTLTYQEERRSWDGSIVVVEHQTLRFVPNTLGCANELMAHNRAMIREYREHANT